MLKKDLGIKLVFLVFGTAMGLLLSEAALSYLRESKSGSEFESMGELRAAMLKPERVSPGTLREIIEPNRDDQIIYELKPNLDLTFQRARVVTNSCGMRDVPRSVKKPVGTYRIALLGDSFVFGWGVEQNETFGAVLERTLNSLAHGKLRFEVLNFGVPGYSTFQEVALFKAKALEFDPDAALVFFVDNDFGMPFFVRDIYQSGGILAATEFARLTWKAFNPDLERQKTELSGLGPNKALGDLADINAQYGIRTYLSINPNQKAQKIQKMLPVLRKRREITAIQLRPDLLRYIELHGIQPADLSLGWDPHPSALKHKLLGWLLAPWFMDVIESK